MDQPEHGGGRDIIKQVETNEASWIIASEVALYPFYPNAIG